MGNPLEARAGRVYAECVKYRSDGKTNTVARGKRKRENDEHKTGEKRN